MPFLPLPVFHYDSPCNSAPVNLDSRPGLVFLALHSCSREFLLPSLHTAIPISLSFKFGWNLTSSIKTFLVHHFSEWPLSAPKLHGISLLQNSLDQLDWAWVFLTGAQLLNPFPILEEVEPNSHSRGWRCLYAFPISFSVKTRTLDRGWTHQVHSLYLEGKASATKKSYHADLKQCRGIPGRHLCSLSQVSGGSCPHWLPCALWWQWQGLHQTSSMAWFGALFMTGPLQARFSSFAISLGLRIGDFSIV